MPAALWFPCLPPQGCTEGLCLLGADCLLAWAVHTPSTLQASFIWNPSSSLLCTDRAAGPSTPLATF